jgi:hypothetical protein
MYINLEKYVIKLAELYAKSLYLNLFGWSWT